MFLDLQYSEWAEVKQWFVGHKWILTWPLLLLLELDVLDYIPLIELL